MSVPFDIEQACDENDEKDNTEQACDEKLTEGNILHCTKNTKKEKNRPMETTSK